MWEINVVNAHQTKQFSTATVIWGRLEVQFQLFWQHCADVAPLDSAGSVLFLSLSPPTAEQQNNIIHCAATCKIPLPKAPRVFLGRFWGVLIKFFFFFFGWCWGRRGGKKNKTLHDIPRVFTQVKRGRDNSLPESASSGYDSVHVCMH